MTNPDLGEWIKTKIMELREKSEYPMIELTALAESVLEKPREWIIAHPDTPLNKKQYDALKKAYTRLLKGEPLAYITGRRSFYGLDFYVDSNVLIPRPETELLVDLALAWLRENSNRKHVADVGTGSGAIAITLAHHLAGLEITAIDISKGALEVASDNAIRLSVSDQLIFFCNDLLKGLDEKFDLIVANLPYIPENDMNNLPELRYEPRTALDGGRDGLRFIERLISSSKNNMAENGCMILEIQYNQWKEVRDIASQHYPQAHISIHHDLGGQPRVVTIQL